MNAPASCALKSNWGDPHARASTELRMLRPRPAARVARCNDLHVRVHVLRALCERCVAGYLSELRRRAGATAGASCRQAGEASGVDEARAETRGLRKGVKWR